MRPVTSLPLTDSTKKPMKFRTSTLVAPALGGWLAVARSFGSYSGTAMTRGLIDAHGGVSCAQLPLTRPPTASHDAAGSRLMRSVSPCAISTALLDMAPVAKLMRVPIDTPAFAHELVLLRTASGPHWLPGIWIGRYSHGLIVEMGVETEPRCNVTSVPY